MASLARSAALDNSFYWLLALHSKEFNDTPSVSFIEEWIREHFVFQPELVEIVRTPQFMLSEILAHDWFSGDCDDAATFAAALLKMCGYPAEFVAIRYSNPSEFEHVFVVSGNFIVDPTVPYGTDYHEMERMIERV